MSRDSYIDFLRALGLISIMMVHCDIPRWLYQINLFNVPLMVIVSGLVADGSIKKRYISYLVSRTKRLVLPTWIFVTFFLLFLFVLTKAGLINNFIFNCNNIISSYSLLDSESGGIGFVWIIRVFLLTMLIVPWAVVLNKKLKSGGYYVCIILLLLLQVVLNIPSNIIDNSIIYKQFLLIFVGYQVFIWYGVKLRSINSSETKVVFAILITISIIMLLYRVFIWKMDIKDIEYKYPPYFDYQIYGMTITTILWIIKKKIGVVTRFSLFQFIGKNTLWIYFWHVPVVLTLKSLLRGYNWSVVFFLTVLIATVCYYLQYRIVKLVNNKYLTKYLIG